MENHFGSNRRLVGVPAKKEKEFQAALEEVQLADRKTEKDIEQPEGFSEIFKYLQENLEIFLRDYGLQSSSIKSLEMIIFSPNHPYRDAYNAHGCWINEVQKIEIYNDFKGPHKLAVISTLVHEMIHAEAFQSWQEISKNEKDSTTVEYQNDDTSISFYKNRRQGLSINNGALGDYFSDLDEAVTEELAIRFMEKYRNNIPLLEDDIYMRNFVLDDTSNNLSTKRREVRSIDEETEESSEPRMTMELAGYREEREALWKLIADISEKNERLASYDEVFKVIAQGAITGNIFPFARLVEETFGRGTFRALGQKTMDEPMPPSLR